MEDLSSRTAQEVLDDHLNLAEHFGAEEDWRRVVEALFSEFHAGGDNHAARKRGFEQFVRPADPPVPSLKVSAIPEWSPDAYCACHRVASA